MTKTTSTPLWLVAAPDWLDPKWGGPNVTVMPAALGEQLKRERQQAQHERDVAIERVAPLLDALKEAREMVASWGAYVSAYFREKHDLAGNLKWLDDTIALAPGGSQTQPNTAVGESGTAAASLDVIVQHARDAVAEAQEDDGVVTIKAEMLSLLLEGLERLKTERHEFYLEQLRLLERQPVEPKCKHLNVRGSVNISGHSESSCLDCGANLKGWIPAHGNWQVRLAESMPAPVFVESCQHPGICPTCHQRMMTEPTRDADQAVTFIRSEGERAVIRYNGKDEIVSPYTTFYVTRQAEPKEEPGDCKHETTSTQEDDRSITTICLDCGKFIEEWPKPWDELPENRRAEP